MFQHLGWRECGVIQVGMKADVKVIDYAGLKLDKPKLVRDLPAGGKRFLQKACGFVATLVSGTIVAQHGKISDARPGRLVRANSSS